MPAAPLAMIYVFFFSSIIYFGLSFHLRLDIPLRERFLELLHRDLNLRCLYTLILYVF